MLLVSVTFYVRSKIGQKNFRLLHYASYAAFLLVSWHAMGAGTDTSALRLVYVPCIGGVGLLTVWRIWNAG
jgi:hypothetical protein